MSNSNQEIIEAKLASYIDGELDPADRAELEVHLEQNPQYRRLVEELRKGREMLRGLPRVSAPPELAEAFTSQLERSVLLEGETDKPEPRMQIGMWPRVFATAAIVFLTFGLTAIVYFVLPGKGGHLVAIDTAPTTRPSEADKDLKKTSGSLDDKESLAENSTDQKRDATAAKESDASASPDHLGKSLPAVAGTSAASEDEAVAQKKAMAKSQYALADRDAELEKLARDVSSAPQVRELLSSSVTDKAAGDGGHPVVMVVRTSDPDQAKKDLYAYLADNKIDWQVAPARVDASLSATLAQQNEQMRINDPQAIQEQRSRAQSRGLPEKQNTEKLRDAAPAADDAAKSHSETAAKGAAAAPALAKPSAAPTPAAVPPAPGAPRSPVAAARIAPAPQSPVPAKPELLALQTATPAIDNLYVARRLSRRQADELTTCLARSAEVRKAGASDALVTERLKSPSAPTATDEGNAPAAPVEAARNGAPVVDAQQPPRQAGQPWNLTAENARKDATGARGGAVDGLARRDEEPVKKGDELRLSYGAENGATEKAETVKVQQDGTIAPQSLASAKSKSLQAAGKTVTEIERELQQLTADSPAPIAPPPVKVSRMESDRMAGGGAGLGAGKAGEPGFGAAAPSRRQQAASAPALAAAGPTTAASSVLAPAESLVDVVIIFERETPSGAPPAVATPRPASPSAPAGSAPATQPSSGSPAK